MGLKRVFKQPERLSDERLIDISNLDAEGKVSRRDSPKNLSNFANQLWHSDSSFMKPRAAYSMLHALVTPGWGDNTEFADLRAPWDALDECTPSDVEGLVAEHYALHTRLLLGDDAHTDAQKQEIPPAVWPLADVHPGSGRKLLFVGVHARAMVGWPTAEARMFLADLLEHATPRGASASTCTNGRWATSSSGTTAPPCTAAGATTWPSTASCAARRSSTRRRRCSTRA